MSSLLRRVAVVALLVVAAQASLRAQSAKPTGSVLLVGVGDVDTGQPLEGAQVWLRAVGRLARANGMGEATFHGLPKGTMHITARMLGYLPMDIDVLLSGSDSVEATLLMRRAATALDTVRITAAVIPANLQGFAARRAQGLGRFITESDLAAEHHRELPYVLATRFPGVRVVTDLEGRRHVVNARGTGAMSRPGCEPTIFLDGWPLVDNDIDFVNTDELAGIEWYPGDSAPIQYRRSGYACGTLLLWSKW